MDKLRATSRRVDYSRCRGFILERREKPQPTRPRSVTAAIFETYTGLELCVGFSETTLIWIAAILEMGPRLRIAIVECVRVG